MNCPPQAGKAFRLAHAPALKPAGQPDQRKSYKHVGHLRMRPSAPIPFPIRESFSDREVRALRQGFYAGVEATWRPNSNGPHPLVPLAANLIVCVGLSHAGITRGERAVVAVR